MTVFFTDILSEGISQGGVFGDGDDFTRELVLVPEVVFKGRPDDFGNARLFGEDEAVAMVGGFEGGETERLGDGAHDKDVGVRVDVAEFLATDKAGEDDVVGYAEVGREGDEVVKLFAIAGKNEKEFWVSYDSFFGGTHEKTETFLDGKTTDSGNDGVAVVFELRDVFIGVVVILVVRFEVRVIERIINDVDFIERDAVFFVNETFGRLGNGDDFVG